MNDLKWARSLDLSDAATRTGDLDDIRRQIIKQAYLICECWRLVSDAGPGKVPRRWNTVVELIAGLDDLLQLNREQGEQT